MRIYVYCLHITIYIYSTHIVPWKNGIPLAIEIIYMSFKRSPLTSLLTHGLVHSSHSSNER